MRYSICAIGMTILVGMGFVISGCSLRYADGGTSGSTQRWQVDFTYDIHPSKPLAVVSVAGEGDNYDLYLIDLQTLQVDPLLETEKRSERYPRFSPDGKYLVYSVGETELADRSPFNLHLLDIETGKEEPLTQGSYYDWGAQFVPDGKTVVFIRHTRLGERVWGDPVWQDPMVCVLDLAQRKVGNTWAVWMDSTSVAPKGEVIVQHRRGGNQYGDWVMVPWTALTQEFSEVSPVQVNSVFLEPYRQVLWAKRSDVVIYVHYTRNRDGQLISHLYRTDREGREPKRLYTEELCEFTNLRFAPDERKVYFTRTNFAEGPPYQRSLWCFDLDKAEAYEVLSAEFLSSLKDRAVRK